MSAAAGRARVNEHPRAPPYLLEELPQHFLAVNGAPVAENCSLTLRVPLPAVGIGV